MQLHATHGEPLLFGKEKDKGLALNRDELALEVIKIGENGHTVDDVLVHDETNPILAQMLINTAPPDFPIVLGVLFCQPAESFETSVINQIAAISKKKPGANLEDLMRKGRTWEVK
jgi:2-oxoglutarate ferredoxin oxidoreductase subunit beta